MAYADIPEALKIRLSSERFRMYHAMWHFARNRRNWESIDWESLPAAERAHLESWKPAHFERESGGGVDFLHMHREMIRMVDAWARETPGGHAGHGAGHGHHGGATGAAQERFVVGWSDIPWDPADPVWPMPVVDLSSAEMRRIFRRSKDPAETAFHQRQCVEKYNNRAWLRSVTLDELGTELEFSIHGWCHMHWSTEPPANPNTLDPANDWLGSPFSSHVNKHFWKLHGWIDDRITGWEDARGEKADLSAGWDGPPDYVTNQPHSADPAFFELLQFRAREPMVMPWDGLLLEG